MFLGPRGPLRVPSIPASPLLSAPKIQVTSAALKIIPGPRQTPHMIYYRKEEDVIYHMVMKIQIQRQKCASVYRLKC